MLLISHSSNQITEQLLHVFFFFSFFWMNSINNLNLKWEPKLTEPT